MQLDSESLLVATHRGELRLLNLADGSRSGFAWQPQRSGIYSLARSPDGAYLYYSAERHTNLQALDLRRGRVKWQRKDLPVSGAMTCNDTILVTTYKDGSLTALDAGNGSTLWESTVKGSRYCGNWLFDDVVLTLNDRGILGAYPISGPASGANGQLHKPDWTRQLSLTPATVGRANFRLLALADSKGRIMAFNPATRDVVFETSVTAPVYSRPVVTDSMIIVADASGMVTALAAGNGALLWEYPGPGLVNLPLMMANQPTAAVVVPFARGLVIALDYTTGAEIWRYQAGKTLRLVTLTSAGVVVADRGNHLVLLGPAELEGHIQ